MSKPYTSHSGKSVPIEAMADRHLESAIAKLQVEEAGLCAMLAGLDPAKVREWKKQVAHLVPAFTLGEALERSRQWLSTLQAEHTRREKIKWPELG